MAPLLENASIKQVERELARGRGEHSEGEQSPSQRTSVMNHVAWVPERWTDAAMATLDGMQERLPSRAIVLFPRPDDPRDAIDADVDVRCFTGSSRSRGVCFEVILLYLRGARAAAPASVVEPLLVPDLPDFLRWRGDLPFEEPQLEQLVDVADRLVVDSSEWRGPEEAFARLPALFDRVVVSDVAWGRLEPWREAIAQLWPGIADASALRVAGPKADALLLVGWLRSRLGSEISLEHEPAGEIELVEVDGDPVDLVRREPKSMSDLLSDQLDIFERDRIYEDTLRSFSGVPT